MWTRNKVIRRRDQETQLDILKTVVVSSKKLHHYKIQNVDVEALVYSDTEA